MLDNYNHGSKFWLSVLQSTRKYFWWESAFWIFKFRTNKSRIIPHIHFTDFTSNIFQHEHIITTLHKARLLQTLRGSGCLAFLALGFLWNWRSWHRLGHHHRRRHHHGRRHHDGRWDHHRLPRTRTRWSRWRWRFCLTKTASQKWVYQCISMHIMVYGISRSIHSLINCYHLQVLSRSISNLDPWSFQFDHEFNLYVPNYLHCTHEPSAHIVCLWGWLIWWRRWGCLHLPGKILCWNLMEAKTWLRV